MHLHLGVPNKFDRNWCGNQLKHYEDISCLYVHVYPSVRTILLGSIHEVLLTTYAHGTANYKKNIAVMHGLCAMINSNIKSACIAHSDLP